MAVTNLKTSQAKFSPLEVQNIMVIKLKVSDY